MFTQIIMWQLILRAIVNRVFLLLLCIVLTASLEAYSKKVILGTFSTELRAQNQMEQVLETSPIISSLSKKHNFDVKVRKSGLYYIIVAEVFYDRDVLNVFLKESRKTFDGLYVSNHTVSKTEVKVSEKKVLDKKPVKVQEKKVKIKKEVIKVTPLEEKKPEIKKLEVKKEISKPKEKISNEKPVLQNPIKKEQVKLTEATSTDLNFFQKHFKWSYLVILINLIVPIALIIYYIKFKRIYNKY